MNAPLPHASVINTGSMATTMTRKARRRRRGEREADKALHNHATERWMVSYADFMTLLFAFFVVMYAISSVNEGRYRVLSGALTTAFSQAEGEKALAENLRVAQATTTVAAGTPATGLPIAPSLVEAVPVPDATKAADPEPPIDATERAELARNTERAQRMQQLAAKMDAHMQSLVTDGRVKVTRGARGIAIEINAAVLFDPAHADLKPASFDALKSVADTLANFVEPLQIEGHSDDVPIATREFRSNWELSAARAASVARFLVAQGISPERIGIAGYAEFRPLVGNSDAQTRARNRRVTIVVLSADDAKPQEGGTPAAAPE